MNVFRRTIKQLLVAAFLVVTMVLPSYALAQQKNQTTAGINSALDQAGQTGFGMTGQDATAIGLGGLVGTYVTAFLGFVGTIAFVVFLYGGFLWLTARGNDDQVADAKKYLFNGTVGVAVIVLAYSAAYFITAQLYKASGGR